MIPDFQGVGQEPRLMMFDGVKSSIREFRRTGGLFLEGVA
jgi:hypothetical protein